MNKSREDFAEIYTEMECGLVKTHEEENVESRHAESSVLDNLYSGTGWQPGKEITDNWGRNGQPLFLSRS